ncbi:expansin-like B1 [Lycium barbarum]|uniref:expansin-like B1 n=1 Tax=Lycium barbarum TaxID=112863 RepID=UPI00293E687A|nr:expansin-like B1 [Lycium barbarum]
MDLSLKYSCIFICMIMLLPAFSYSQTLQSKAAFYATADGMGTPTGACGYETYGKDVNNGEVCTASRRIFRNGAGCGACYQVRCKNSALCSEEGTKVVVTDSADGQETDFILSFKAYAKLAKHPSLAPRLCGKGVVDIEYRRVSCRYWGNLMVKIHEHSKYSEYLAIVFLNQGGTTDIHAVEVYEEESQQWIAMRRAYGAVWDLASPPCGDLKLRFLISTSVETKWVQSDKAVIPAQWSAGLTVETDILLT